MSSVPLLLGQQVKCVTSLICAVSCCYRREKLEIFDEVEEFHLLQAHYCVVVASKLANTPTAQALTLVKQ